MARGGDRVTIVWDARCAPADLPARETSHGVEHEFARREATADDALLARLRSADEPHRSCVISDDGEVARRAKQLGAAVRSVAETEARVAALPGARPGGDRDADDVKPAPPRGEEVNEWSRLFGEAPPE